MDYSSIFFLLPTFLLVILLLLLFTFQLSSSVLPLFLVAVYFSILAYLVLLKLTFFTKMESWASKSYSLWDNTEVRLTLLLDSSTVEFSLILLFLSFIIQIYALNYFKKDPELSRFSLLLGLFIFFMLLMIHTTSWVLMFITWEGVGLLSFLLVSFWYSKVNTLKSGFKVLFYNRLGDFFFFLALGLVLYITKNDNLLSSLSSMETQKQILLSLFIETNLLVLVAFSLLLVILSKSAQFGFHVWLLEAMEAPLPASSLIHSATLVCAGAVLLFKIPAVGLLLGELTAYVVVWSCFTSCLLSFSALFNYDIKKVLAYSTGSHISLILALALSCGVNLGFAYTLVHASSKVFIFLLFGFLIDANGGTRDIRRFGSFFKVTGLAYYGLLGVVGLSSLPVVTLASLKDSLILGLTRGGYIYELSASMLMFSSILNYSYMLRLFFKIFFGDPLSSARTYLNRYALFKFQGAVSWKSGRTSLPLTPLLPLLVYILTAESNVLDLVGTNYLGGESFLVEVLPSLTSEATLQYLGFANSFFFFFLLIRVLYRFLR